MEPLISNLEVVSASKQGVQLLEENNIASMYSTQPEEIEPVVTAALALMNRQSPLDYIIERMGAVQTIPISNPEMQWKLEIRPDNGFTITKSPDEIYGAVVTTLGYGKQTFQIGVGDSQAFIPNDVIVPEDERYQLLVKRTFEDGLNTILEVEIYNNVSSISSTKLQQGMKLTRWATVGSEYSVKGGSAQINRPITLRNSLMILRDSFEITRSAKTTKSVIELTNPNNPSEKTYYWADRYYWAFLEQVKRATDIMLLEGSYNKGTNIETIARDENNRPIKNGAGLHDQIAPSNNFYYNGVIEYDYLDEIVSELANQVTTFGTGANLTLFAGKGLRRAITNAVNKKFGSASFSTILQTGITYLKDDKNDEFQFFSRQCSQIQFGFGNVLNIVPMDIYSDYSYYKQKISNGFPDTRKSMDGFIINVGNMTKKNLVKVYREGAENIMAIVEGLIGLDGKAAKNPTSGVDAVTGHCLREVGIAMKDPFGSARIIYTGN